MKRVIALCLTLTACGSSTAPPPQIEGAVPFADTQLLESLWTGLDACTGKTMDMSDISFYTVPGESLTVDGQAYWGYWFRDGNRVYLADRVKSSAVAIEHEMMHARLQDSSHPDQYFNGVCGNLYVAVSGQG